MIRIGVHAGKGFGVKLVIIESPYKGDVARNKRYLRACIRDCVFRRGESPYASHRMLTDALDDDNPKERALGIEAGLAWMKAGTMHESPLTYDLDDFELATHVFYVDLGMSRGMEFAKKRYDDERIPYEERTLPPDDPFFAESRRGPETPSELWWRAQTSMRDKYRATPPEAALEYPTRTDYEPLD